MASASARSSMINRGMKIEVDWEKNTKNYRDNMDNLVSNYLSLEKKNIVYPSYYEKPFHAYDNGNLCWEGIQLIILNNLITKC